MKTPLVVIVGRPNVGKSTLYNRFVGKRRAIVDDRSGVTRDRNYSEAEWAGKKFTLIDTGGYVPASEDVFEKAIREQVEIAIAEADAILFMVDVRTGVNPMGVEIANLLRSSEKNFYLLANKVDSENFEAAAAEFYSLGVDKVYDISAIGGRKIGDLLDEVTSHFDEAVEEEADTRLKLAIVGRPNVGKSSLVTAGLRKKKRVQESIEFYSNIRTLKAIGDCDVAIVMIDAQFGLEKQDQKIIDEVIRWKKGLIIAVNKWDLIEKDTNTADRYKKNLFDKLGAVNYAELIFISALTKQRIFKLLEICKVVAEERGKKIPTNQLNDELLTEIKNNPPPATQSGKEVKIKYITQVGDYYPIFAFFCNYPKQVADNYKRYIENLIRRLYGFQGVPITLSF